MSPLHRRSARGRAVRACGGGPGRESGCGRTGERLIPGSTLCRASYRLP